MSVTPVSHLSIGVVGLGLHGRGIAELAIAQGYHVVGAVDIGDKVGSRLADFVAGALEGPIVHGELDELLALRPDAVVLAAAVDIDVIVDQARRALEAGVNALTLHSDLFAYDSAWAEPLREAGARTGASFLSTGVQDTWWVQTPALAASSTVNLRKVRITHVVDANSLSPEVGRMVGIGSTLEELLGRAETGEGEERPILGDPLREAARKLGLTIAGEAVTTVAPIVAEREFHWTSADRIIAAGLVIGTEERTDFTTEEGVDFEATLRTCLLDAGTPPSDELVIEADPTLHLRHAPFPGDAITNVALVNRIPDVVAAPGGVLSSADLPPASYRHPAR